MEFLMNKKCHEWMVTFSGKKFYPADPNPEDINIEDIAHALSMICRFGGHVFQFYSVAQHSVLVSQIHPQDRFKALMHDATEAFVGECIRPIKVNLSEFNELEAGVWRAICFRFGMTEEIPQSIKDADNRLLMTEKRDLTNSSHLKWIPELEEIEPLPGMIFPCPQPTARDMFLNEFENLYEAKENLH